jgi:hypothetical protein
MERRPASQSVYRIRQIERWQEHEVTPMETQAIRSQIEAATPMAPVPSKQSSPKVDNANDAKLG